MRTIPNIKLSKTGIIFIDLILILFIIRPIDILNLQTLYKSETLNK
jgi:hypothetical protein